MQFQKGDRIRVLGGTFRGHEGVVTDVLSRGAVKIELLIFGRPVPVELESWEVQLIREAD
jgi:transcription antitermination factor NusG